MKTPTYFDEPNTIEALKTGRKCKPLTSRLRKSKNFHKEDRMLDDYLDRCTLIKCGPKRCLRKLLKLRTGEDDNEVKVTVSGLSKLLAVNVKTIRSWLKALEAAGFIYYQGDQWDRHCNFPKKTYSFPVTFPGFDLSTVFIRRDAKAKYKARMANPEKAANQRAKVAALTKENTCPVVPRLLDCPTSINESGTWNHSIEDTKVSSPHRIPVNRKAIAKQKPSRFEQVKTWERKPFKILDLSPELKGVLRGALSQKKQKGQLSRVSRFIEQMVAENTSIQTFEDREELAADLEYVVPQAFLHFGGNIYVSLCRFLRQYITLYMGHSYYQNDWRYAPNRYETIFRRVEEQEKLFKQYPFCDPDDYVERTGVNRC